MSVSRVFELARAFQDMMSELSEMLPFQSLKSLEVDKQYYITAIDTCDVGFGETIVATIEGQFNVLLPYKKSDFAEKYSSILKAVKQNRCRIVLTKDENIEIFAFVDMWAAVKKKCPRCPTIRKCDEKKDDEK